MNTEQQFFSLLRFSLDVTSELEEPVTDWEAMYDVATKQSLRGVLFCGVERLPKDQQPSDELMVKWFVKNDKIRKANERVNANAVALTEALRKKGFRCCVLKGQGNALLYPRPFMRTSGDIDAWLQCTPAEAIAFVRKYMPTARAEYHHVDFGMFNKTDVEAHYRPSFMNNLVNNGRLQRYFREQAEAQFAHEVTLPQGTISVPTAAFNRIYQMAHISNHLIHEGIGLRQLVDYYYVLRQGFSPEEQAADAVTLKRCGLMPMAGAVVYVLRQLLRLEERYWIVAPDERRGRFLLNEIMAGGNFGKYDERVAHSRHHTFAANMERLRRDWRLMGLFPSECLNEPIFRVYHYFWRRKYAPRGKRD